MDKSTCLNLDQPLNLLGVLEALQLLDELRLHLERQHQEQLVKLCLAASLRLCFVALQAPLTEVDRNSLRALQRHSQDKLSRSLESLPDSLQQLAQGQRPQ